MDEAVVMGVGPCARCRQVFMFDPDTVPSVWCDTTTGVPREPEPVDAEAGRVARMPLCQWCADVVSAAAHAGRAVLWTPWR